MLCAKMPWVAFLFSVPPAPRNCMFASPLLTLLSFGDSEVRDLKRGFVMLAFILWGLRGVVQRDCLSWQQTFFKSSG